MARGPVRAAVALAPLLLLLLLARTPAARGGRQQEQQPGGLHATLDSMARLMGEKRFDPGFAGRIDACLAKHRGAEFQDRYWEGFVTEGTNSSAEWGKKAPKDGRHHGFLEYNVTVMDVGVPVYEPCNFASNMVYYHTMVQICDREAAGGWAVSAPTVHALVTTYAGLAAGSALKHAAGQTRLGYVVDNLGIQLFTFISHQAALEPLGVQSSAVLWDLSDAGHRNASAVEFSRRAAAVVTDRPVRDWLPPLGAMLEDEVPWYLRSCGTILSTVFTLALPDPIGMFIIKLIANSITGPGAGAKEEVAFLEQRFLPELRLRLAEAGVKLTVRERVRLLRECLGFLTKMMYAFSWQEELWPGFWIPLKVTNRFGGRSEPYVNSVGNALSGLRYSADGETVQKCDHVYPGDSWCRTAPQPHAKWHEMSGNALFDMARMVDEVHRVLQAKVAPTGKRL